MTAPRTDRRSALIAVPSLCGAHAVWLASGVRPPLLAGRVMTPYRAACLDQC